MKLLVDKGFREHLFMENKDITVVLQGSTLSSYFGERCIELSVASVLKVLPGAKIILSTWENEDIPCNISNLVEKILYNKDPGAVTRDCTPAGKPNNINRQIVSTINGLKEVKTKYAIKMRTDFILKSDDFKKYFDKFCVSNNNFKIFEKRIICSMFGTRKPYAKNFNLPFHISDFFFFGLTTDLINLFDIPLVTQEEFYYFTIHTEFMPDTYARNKYNAEQSLWVNCLTKNGVDVKCKYSTHVDDDIAIQSDKYLVNNFYPISFNKLGIKPLKKDLLPQKHISVYSDYYTQDEWKTLYRQYCDNTYKCPVFDTERFFSNFCILLLEKLKLKCIARWLMSLFF